ncbi:MAG: ankyrin repeat domain-containing protein [Verrucomicrobiota bacterium]
MNGISRGLVAATAVACCVLPLTGCRKRTDTVKADLGEAGYKLTPEDWFRASRSNDLEALKKFVAGGFSADTRDAAGDSGLHAAAAAGAIEAANFLLNRGLAVDLTGGGARTPLMAAVIANQTDMVRWLLRQGADPRLKDADGFRPLMLAVREGSAGSVAELASYDREDLDPALLLAAMVGKEEVIDALTNYGASVYTRMEDGRTPLMIAAQNGHAAAVKLLLEIGSSRYTKDTDGRTAAEIASEAGFPEITAMIVRDPLPAELALESPEEIAEEMDAYVNAESAPEESATVSQKGMASISIDGETLSAPVAGQASERAISKSNAAGAGEPSAAFAMPPLVMRAYREREVPMSVETVRGDAATLRIDGITPREVTVRAGQKVPNSNLVVVRVQRRMEDSKVNPGGQAEISVVELRDATSGASREWIAGVPSHSHDPVGLVEDAATGKRYIASPGQRFSAQDGSTFLVTDVRPNQMVIRDEATGKVRTIPLRGPRG